MRPDDGQASLFGDVPHTSATAGDAWFSDDGRYRYLLRRRWSPSPAAVFVMLNPSTANAACNDPTIGRCVAFARAWGCGGIWVVNIFAYCAADPDDLPDDPAEAIGPDNHVYLLATTLARPFGAPLIAAWGARAPAWRVAEVLDLAGDVPWTCLGATKSGAPKHPLARGRHRVPDDQRPVPWERSA